MHMHIVHMHTRHPYYACMLCKLDRGKGRDIEREVGRDREMEGEKEKAR